MRRRTFDVIASSVGALLTILLILAGALLLWAYLFIDHEVHTQLAAQKIFFPAADSQAITSANVADRYLRYSAKLPATQRQ